MLAHGVRVFPAGEQLDVYLEPCTSWRSTRRAVARSEPARGGLTMARIDLANVRHAYGPDPKSDARLRAAPCEPGVRGWRRLCAAGPVRLRQDLDAQHHLRPRAPTQGRVRFDGEDVTDLPTEKRNIAQVFQFPVIYDSMTVRENLAFPLRNRGVKQAEIEPARRRSDRDDRPEGAGRPPCARADGGREAEDLAGHAGWCGRTSAPSCSTSR